jgi:UDP-GlcNAc:undecaprenyl-phosphate/decaprenyl-phosphate GlcNAc-1-phosphate transferase
LPGDVLIMLGLAGAALGFLRYNFHPASIFLGDSGSMFLGFTFAAISLSTVSKDTAVISVAVPLLAAGVPIFDMFLAVWRRTVRGLVGAPEQQGRIHLKDVVFAADTDHLHHRLMRRGLSQQSAAFWLYLLAVVLVALGLVSLSCRSHRLGIYLIAFVVGAYVAVRHLAQVEVWHSATAIAQGLRRPPRKVLAVILFPPLDVLLLAFSLALALLLLRGHTAAPEGMRQVWLDQLPIWVGIPFIAVALSGSYRRVWSQARVSDYVFLAMALAAGLLTGAGLTGIVETWGKRALLLQLVLYAGVAIPLLAGVRAFPRTVQDLLDWSRRRRRPPRAGGKNVLIYGAGHRSALLIREVGTQPTEEDGFGHVVGFLAEDRNLHGRFIHGYEVLGGVDALPEIAARHDVREVVIADPPEPGVRQRLIDRAGQHGITVVEWLTQVRALR